jgi:hypothetical protein
MERALTAPAPTDALRHAERDVVDAAVLWVADQDCALALAELEEAVERYLSVRRVRRAESTADEVAA